MKQTVEEAARTHWSESTYNKDTELAYDERDSIAIKALAKSVALRAFKKGADWQSRQSPWISVEERLPKDIPGAPLVVILEDGKTGYYNARYTDNYEFVTMDGQLLHNVAYWQPIPLFRLNTRSQQGCTGTD
ncbi:DUF551 domain-containing protein [Bacteroides clarus]|uniref:DUF551 domain-containing protein n=1 Tax=Bacteroides clarus TaxID=626929 RepID=UPI002048FEC9|nr:DUF551 domain-containing protein [Bacteroides clarus]DAZ80165.1 MAG TPA: Protein of unknown function (DUF551) [Caudoviricetes sp.]